MTWFRKLGWCSFIVIVLSACAFEAEVAPTPAPAARPTVAFTPIALPTTIPTAPPPPIPTTAPSPTPAPTQAGATPAPTQAINTEMVEIKGGSFTMGSNNGAADAKPAYQVEVPAFFIDKFEVTNDDFKKFVDATSYKTDAEKANEGDWKKYADGKGKHPVVLVTWNDATAFCKWAGKRLPTEQEWEKAARGADGRAFPWGNDYDPKKANVKEGNIRTTTVVGSFGAGTGPYGVQDMAGNVWEWTVSEAQVYPGGQRSSKIFTAGTKVVRGGGWFDVKEQVASYARNSNVPLAANDDLGFRCAK
jgi:iron(II)-dependent oxidoreductase